MSKADRIPRRGDAGRADAGRVDAGRADAGRVDAGRAEPGHAHEAVRRPLYARALRLRYLSPGGIFCFIFLEGAIALGILLALAELVSWWGVIVLPVTVALMVKLNDLIAGLLGRSSRPAKPVAARAAVLHPAADGGARRANLGEESTTRLSGAGRPAETGTQSWGERLETHQQWVRQSATRRYE